MSTKNIRKCVGCQCYFDIKSLIKLTFSKKTKLLHLQPTTRINGRSAYICYNKSCITISLKKARIEKSLRKHLPDEITEMLHNIAK